MLARVRNSIAENRVFLWMKRHKKLSIIFLIALVILVVIFRPKGPEPLETATVSEGTIREVLSATGTVEAESMVNLTFLAGGRVTYVGVAEGDMVEKGQTIATVDQRSAQKNLENALRDYAKQRNTYEQTKQDKGTLDISSQSESVRRVLENNQFDLEKAVASVELQQITKQNSVLVSPIDGIVTRADITVPGVNAALTTTYTIVDPDSLVFQIEIDSADIGKVKLGQKVEILLDAYPEQTLSGSIIQIDFASHDTDTGGNAFYVDVELPLGTVDYRIGMGGDAEILFAQKQHTTVIPLAAVEDERYVYVRKNEKYERRTITSGLQSDTEIEILSGLKRGEEVALQPEEAAKRVEQKRAEPRK